MFCNAELMYFQHDMLIYEVQYALVFPQSNSDLWKQSIFQL